MAINYKNKVKTPNLSEFNNMSDMIKLAVFVAGAYLIFKNRHKLMGYLQKEEESNEEAEKGYYLPTDEKYTLAVLNTAIGTA